MRRVVSRKKLEKGSKLAETGQVIHLIVLTQVVMAGKGVVGKTRYVSDEEGTPE